MMNTFIADVKHLYKLKRSVIPLSHALSLLVLFIPVTASADRFDPPSINAPLLDFKSRLEGNIFNVDFLLAHVINNAKKTVRETGEIVDSAQSILNDTAIFTNTISTPTSGGTNAGSIVIPPGTTADTIIIINQIDGDSIAIQR